MPHTVSGDVRYVASRSIHYMFSSRVLFRRFVLYDAPIIDGQKSQAINGCRSDNKKRNKRQLTALMSFSQR
jgi:hypothetical protein